MKKNLSIVPRKRTNFPPSPYLLFFSLPSIRILEFLPPSPRALEPSFPFLTLFLSRTCTLASTRVYDVCRCAITRDPRGRRIWRRGTTPGRGRPARRAARRSSRRWGRLRRASAVARRARRTPSTRSAAACSHGRPQPWCRGAG